ncbi:MAG TPA: PspA/IM30 family protein [Pirellulaceae bacterium]|nr:PspA/IM30 family protein [Pirellulaceae bacterium]
MFKRISDIISANLNDMTEQFEDPEKMLRQAIREMEETINDATQQTAKAMASEKTLARELDRNQQQVALWQDRAVKAVDAGDDDLARKGLARKQEHEKLVVALEDQLQSAAEANKTLRHQLDAMKAKLAEAKRNLSTLGARKRAADFRKKLESPALAQDIDNNAFAKFDRLKNRVEQAEAEAEALAELRGNRCAAAVSEVEAIPEDLDVSAELAALKQQRQR